jgi:diacylglycerol O-acyltransferase
MRRLKSSPEALVAKQLLRVMGWAPSLVEDLGVAFFAQKASLVLTNVPGPRERLTLAGLPVKRLLFWVPQSGRMGLGVSLFSYAGQVTVGVMADAQVLERPQGLVDDLATELKRIEVASSATAPRVARPSRVRRRGEKLQPAGHARGARPR